MVDSDKCLDQHKHKVRYYLVQLYQFPTDGMDPRLLKGLNLPRLLPLSQYPLLGESIYSGVLKYEYKLDTNKVLLHWRFGQDTEKIGIWKQDIEQKLANVQSFCSIMGSLQKDVDDIAKIELPYYSWCLLPLPCKRLQQSFDLNLIMYSGYLYDFGLECISGCVEQHVDGEYEQARERWCNKFLEYYLESNRETVTELNQTNTG